MSQASPMRTVIAVVAVGASLWLWHVNRGLHDELDAANAARVARADAPAAAAADHADPVAAAPATPRLVINSNNQAAPPPPVLPTPAEELHLDRRARKMMEFTSIFGRVDGESEADYRARIGPLLAAGLAIPRAKVTEMRNQAEEKAGVTPDQSRRLDQAFEKTYGNILDYANKSISDGTLSPYQHDFAGWLEFAGGIGGILNASQDQIGQILSPDQLKAMSASGFDWGEYMSAQAPWEKLGPPPPAK